MKFFTKQFIILKKEIQRGKEHVQLKILSNEAIDPKNLGSPKGLDKKDVPMLTTDYYYIATPEDGDKYAALEMDDTVVGIVAKTHGS